MQELVHRWGPAGPPRSGPIGPGRLRGRDVEGWQASPRPRSRWGVIRGGAGQGKGLGLGVVG